MILRDATIADFPSILALNAAWVHFLSPLDEARLRQLHDRAAYHRLAENDGRVAAFLLAFREGAEYDSPNYRWFDAHYGRFLYVDRVVVGEAARGRGLGAVLYEDVFAFARAAGAERVTCEFDLEPPNPVSERFHRRHGFVEVGRQWLGGGKKQVSLQVRELGSTTADSGMIDD